MHIIQKFITASIFFLSLSTHIFAAQKSLFDKDSIPLSLGRMKDICQAIEKRERQLAMEPLFHALEDGDIKEVLTTINKEKDEKKRALLPCEALHYAIRYANTDKMMRLLFEHTPVKADDKNSLGAVALHIAAEVGKEDELRLLLEKNSTSECVNAQMFNKMTPLHLAAENGRVNAIEILVKHGALVDMQDDCGDTPLHLAIKQHIPGLNDLSEVIRLLVKKGTKQYIANKDGRLPIHLAVQKGIVSIIELLLDDGHEDKHELINAKDLRLGNTPLHYDVGAGYRAIITCLVKRGANVRLPNDAGHTPFHYAAGCAREESLPSLCGLIDKKDADDLVNSNDQQGNPPLNFALEYGRESNVRLLLKMGAAVDHVNTSKATALHIAARDPDNKNILPLLFEGLKAKGKKVEDVINAKDSVGRSALGEALLSGNREFIKTFIEQGATLEGTQGLGSTVLHHAVVNEHDNPEIIKILLQMCNDLKTPIDLNAEMAEGLTPLALAKKFGRTKNAEYLEQVINQSKVTQAQEQKHMDGDRKSVEGVPAGPDKDILFIGELLKIIIGKVKYIPSHFLKAHEATLAKMLKCDVSVIKGYYESSVKDLLEVYFSNVESGAFKVLFIDHSNKVSPHSLTIEPSLIDKYFPNIMLQALKQEPMTAHKKPLHYAAKFGCINIIKACLDESKNGLEVKDEKGNTPLHYALGGGFLDAAMELIAKGARIKTKSKDNFNAVHYAAYGGNEKVLEMLLEHKEFSGIANMYMLEKSKDGRTIVHCAAASCKDNPECIKFVLLKLKEQGLSIVDAVNAVDKSGHTPLIIALDAGGYKNAAFLIEQGACVDAKIVKIARETKGLPQATLELLIKSLPAQNKSKHRKKGKKQKIIIDEKIEEKEEKNLDRKDVKSSVVTIDPKSAWFAAVNQNNMQNVERLLGADPTLINCIQDQNAKMTALHYAVHSDYCNVSLIMLLISRGADVMAKNANGDTFLHCALPIISATDLQTVLIAVKNKRGAKSRDGLVNSADKRGWTSLHFAALYNPELIPVLYQHSADFIGDTDGGTPLHYAVFARNVSSVQAFMPFVTHKELAMEDDSEQTALAFALELSRNSPSTKEKLEAISKMLSSALEDKQVKAIKAKVSVGMKKKK